MADVFTKQQRSKVMASVRGRGNKATEWRLRARLVAAGISGWRIDARDVFGRPDFVFEDARLAVFVDGCFWHFCQECRSLPTSNQEFWQAKILGNTKRDRKVTRHLRRDGWRVLRVWEHELKRDPGRVVERIRRNTAMASGSPDLGLSVRSKERRGKTDTAR